jgi:micrococcal nuclease
VGYVTEIIDGDTIKVGGQSIRFALVDTPEYGEYGFNEARDLIESICPVGSPVLVDEDDGQTQGSHGRMLAVIYCNGTNLNEAVLDEGHAVIDERFCEDSEFSSEEWANKYGCTQTVQPKENSCDPSYTDFCIPFSSADLDCRDIQSKKFTVLQPDQHEFDGDGDGIGCEK